jgi:hypothetical protein
MLEVRVEYDLDDDVPWRAKFKPSLVLLGDR